MKRKLNNLFISLNKIGLKTLLMYVIFQLLNTSFKAQHCQYCNTDLVAICPVSSIDQKLINGLRIFLVDENGIQYPWLSSILDVNPKDNTTISERMLFWQNDLTKSENKNNKKHFSFAGNHYIFNPFWNQKSTDKIYVKIEDIDGRRNGGDFCSMVVPISLLQQKKLCGYGYDYYKTDDYAPLKLTLYPKNKRDSTKVIKQSGNFRFEFDKSPLTNCPECHGCECKLIEVYNGIEQKIFEHVFIGNSLSYNEENLDSIQVADYNFDSYPDFRLFNGHNKFNTYYIYNPGINKFEEHPILSALILIQFDYKTKTAKGSRINTKPFNEKSNLSGGGSYNNVFIFTGENLKDVMVLSYPYLNTWNGYSKKEDSLVSTTPADTSYYIYNNKTLYLREYKNLYTSTKELGGFKFLLERNYYFSKNHPQYGKYVRTITVKSIGNEKILFSNTEEITKHRIDNKNYYTDSLNVADFNFDEFPDFRYYNESNKYHYKVYDTNKNSFVDEPFLNSLNEIEFNFKQKYLIGDILVFDHKDKNLSGMYPNNTYLKSQSRFHAFGTGMKNVKEYYKEYRYTKDGTSAKEDVRYFHYSAYKLNPIKEEVYKIEEAKINTNIKTIIRNPFIFELNNNPNVNIPSEKGAYAQRVKISNLKKSKLLFEIIVYGNKLNQPECYWDSNQVADYNFDGYPDFRICNGGKPGTHTYYFYSKKKDSFLKSKKLSDVYNLKFDFINKTAMGNIIHEYDDMGRHETVMKITFKEKDLKSEEISELATDPIPDLNKLKFVPKKDSALIVTPKVDTLNNKKPEKLFIKQWKNYQFKLIFNPQNIKPSPVYGSYVKVLEVKDLKKDSLIYSRVMRGDKYKEKAICTDSLLIDDYNFDGYPDYKTCNDYEGKRFDYHLYDSKKNNFVKDNLLSGLINVQLFPDSFKLVGFRAAGSIMQDVWMLGKGFPTVKIFSKYITDGSDVQRKEYTYVYKEGRLIEVNTPMPYKVYSKVIDGYRFQLEFNPVDIVIPRDLGSYVKRLSVYKVESNKSEGKVFETSLFANELKETVEQRDSFEVAHYNFDKIPDVKFNNSLNLGQSVYYLSAIDVNEDQVFYYEQNLSHIQQIKRFEDRKKLTGTYTDKTDYNTVSFYGKYLDTMVVVKQNLNTMAITQTITYLNKLGKLKPIPNIKALEPKPKTKKEFGDYNFDGYEDFRTKKNENDERWDFFIYNNKKQSFEIDTLLSKMTTTDFDFENKVFVGQITKHINEDTYTEGYKTVNGRIILYSKSICHREFRYAERVDCTISELKDGKWVETFIHGAE